MRFALLALLLVGACASPKPVTSQAPPPERAPDPPGAAAFLRAALDPDGTVAHADVRRLLGEPQRVRVQTQPNRHHPADTDTLTTFVYPGLTATVFSGTATTNRFLIDVEVTGRGIATPQGIAVGDALARVRSRLGDPDRTAGDALHYDLSTADAPTAPTLVVVPDASGRRVAAVRYLMYTG